MKTVVVVGPDVPPEVAQPTRWAPSTEAFKACFSARGWRVVETSRAVKHRPDLVAGYGWRPIMREAHQRWPEIVVHCDLGFWSRDRFMKLALGDRWSPLVDRDFDHERFQAHRVTIAPAREPGRRVLVCGMSAKAAGTWDLQPLQWEVATIKRLAKAGAKVTYRPKNYGIPIHGVEYDRAPSIERSLPNFDAVVSHHSNAAIDALAAGLPIFVETGIARPMSVPTIEDAVGAQAADFETRARFLRQVAWHQFTLEEIAAGVWLDPPAPLSDNQVLRPE